MKLFYIVLALFFIFSTCQAIRLEDHLLLPNGRASHTHTAEVGREELEDDANEVAPPISLKGGYPPFSSRGISAKLVEKQRPIRLWKSEDPPMKSSSRADILEEAGSRLSFADQDDLKSSKDCWYSKVLLKEAARLNLKGWYSTISRFSGRWFFWWRRDPPSPPNNEEDAEKEKKKEEDVEKKKRISKSLKDENSSSKRRKKIISDTVISRCLGSSLKLEVDTFRDADWKVVNDTEECKMLLLGGPREKVVQVATFGTIKDISANDFFESFCDIDLRKSSSSPLQFRLVDSFEEEGGKSAEDLRKDVFSSADLRELKSFEYAEDWMEYLFSDEASLADSKEVEAEKEDNKPSKKASSALFAAIADALSKQKNEDVIFVKYSPPIPFFKARGFHFYRRIARLEDDGVLFSIAKTVENDEYHDKGPADCEMIKLSDLKAFFVVFAHTEDGDIRKPGLKYILYTAVGSSSGIPQSLIKQLLTSKIPEELKNAAEAAVKPQIAFKNGSSLGEKV